MCARPLVDGAATWTYELGFCRREFESSRFRAESGFRAFEEEAVDVGLGDASCASGSFRGECDGGEVLAEFHA